MEATKHGIASQRRTRHFRGLGLAFAAALALAGLGSTAALSASAVAAAKAPAKAKPKPKPKPKETCKIVKKGKKKVKVCTVVKKKTKNTTPPAAPSVASLLQKLETGVPSGSVSVSEAGSSLLFPLFSIWAPQYESQHSNITISPGAGGSTIGISEAANGAINIGASDAYLAPGQGSATLENIPLAISAQQVNYNLGPSFVNTHLHLSGSVLAQIYMGQITNWNDPTIAALNSGVNLPNEKIVPVYRSDGSGDSFLFSGYLSATSSAWASKYGQSQSFPVISGGEPQKGNAAMVTGCQATTGCIAYIGVSYLNTATEAGLGYAALENKSGNFELPTQTTISDEASAFPTVPPNGAISMIYGPASDGYPIVNYEYAIVQVQQPSATEAAAIKALLAWAIDPANGNSSQYLNQVNFQPLSTSGLSVAVTELQRIY